MQLDDLGRVEVARRFLGERHHQDTADAEVGRDDNTNVRCCLDPAAHGRELGVVEAGSADDDIESVPDAEFDVGHDRIGSGEVDNNLSCRSDEFVQVITNVEGGNQLEIGRSPNRVTDRRTHPALCAQHGNIHDLAHATASAKTSGVNGPITANAGFAVNTSAAMSRTWPSVTESMRASISSTVRISP